MFLLPKPRVWGVILLFAWASAFAADTNVATVQAMREAWLNGVPIPRMSAVFPGDEIQTKTEYADIDAFGSKILVLKDSLVTYEGSDVELEQGGVSVTTSKGVAAVIGDLTVRPANAEWTEFQVVEANGLARIIATKGDLALVDEKGTTSLAAGQETTREIKRKRRRRAAGALPAGEGSILNSKAAMIGGLAAVGGVTGWVLTRGDDPVSPDVP